MSMTSSDTRAGLRVLGAIGLVGGCAAFGIPAAVTSTWGTVGQAATSAANREDTMLLLVWLMIGVVALAAGVVALAVTSRRRKSVRRQVAAAPKPAAPMSPSRIPAHA